MRSTVSVSNARAALPELLDRVAAGDEVTITRHGRPVAVVVRPDTLRVRRADDALAAAATIRSAIDGAGDMATDSHGTLTPERAEELIADVRRSRD